MFEHKSAVPSTVSSFPLSSIAEPNRSSEGFHDSSMELKRPAAPLNGILIRFIVFHDP